MCVRAHSTLQVYSTCSAVADGGTESRWLLVSRVTGPEATRFGPHYSLDGLFCLQHLSLQPGWSWTVRVPVRIPFRITSWFLTCCLGDIRVVENVVSFFGASSHLPAPNRSTKQRRSPGDISSLPWRVLMPGENGSLREPGSTLGIFGGPWVFEAWLEGWVQPVGGSEQALGKPGFLSCFLPSILLGYLSHLSHWA